ncbi:MAG TPA: AraC family transcriptional regulator [Clostridiales bacterium]|nr:AraC family transcriptional regulator [Clostridiales bacterium]
MGLELKTFKKDIDILGLYTFYYFEHSKDFYFTGERHNFWEMVYVDSGEISVIADNAGYIIKQGDVIFHKPMEFHTLASNKKDPHNVMVITFSVKGEAMKFFENKIFTVDSQHKKILSLLLEEAQKTSFSIPNNLYKKLLDIKNSEIGSQQLVISYLEQFLIALMRSNQNNERNGRISRYAKKNAENALVDSIEKYLLDNIYERISLKDICEKFNLSKSYICHLFKEATGKSIIDCYINFKIAEAKKLIRQGNLNFTQISEKLCYTSIHHFTRSFKNITGISPSSYEKSVK